jgi:peptidoglycan/LPS O-acetylase OafA/YrhL
MHASGFRAMSRALVVGLVAVVALAAVDVRFPKGRSASKNWHFAIDHPTVLLHIATASIVVLLALGLFVRSIASRHRRWIALSAIGLAFVALAWAMGAEYVATLSSGPLTGMSLGWLGAIVSYVVGWRSSSQELRNRRQGR